MNDIQTLAGMIQGMEEMGARYVRTDGKHIFFDIPKGSHIDDHGKLKRANIAFYEMFRLKLKVRRIELN